MHPSVLAERHSTAQPAMVQSSLRKPSSIHRINMYNASILSGSPLLAVTHMYSCTAHLWVADNSFEVLLLCAWQCQQAVVDSHRGLAHDVQPVAQQQVVYCVYAATQ